jgi:ribosomal protein S18 acetylase RimI-like enzyme
MNQTIAIRAATGAEAGPVAATLSQAFQADPVSSWLFPDPDDRLARHPHFFRVFIDVALADGRIHTTPGYEAVALWVAVDPDSPGSSKHLGDRFEEACGPSYQRFVRLDEAMYQHHPSHILHAYLAFVGVRPDCQARGLGTALICHRLDELEALRRPAYLEASSTRGRGLYERLGFRRLPPRIDLPQGPSLWPMWRPGGGLAVAPDSTMDGAP